ncbi:MAG: hypothetical protein SFU98_14650 [Leptospiraceae bacterium]|nr:hypothetical protein [Leptospiraceae bacterium]
MIIRYLLPRGNKGNLGAYKDFEKIYPIGIQLGIIGNGNDTFDGLIQIGGFNKANNLNGIQLGILNYAKNSRFPYLPRINMKF